MGLFSKHPDPRETYEVSPSAGNGGKELPGIAGYKGTEPLPKNAMPVIRFKYVRPDGKPE
jgi:hypothetical protein